MKNHHRYRSHADRRYTNALMGRQKMSADEERAFWAAVEIIERLPAFVRERGEALDAMEKLAAAKQRTHARRCSDKRTDRKRRKLIGAKLPLAQAERVERCARLSGVSVYRFVISALDMTCQIVEQKCDGPTRSALD